MNAVKLIEEYLAFSRIKHNIFRSTLLFNFIDIWQYESPNHEIPGVNILLTLCSVLFRIIVLQFVVYFSQLYSSINFNIYFLFDESVEKAMKKAFQKIYAELI